MGVETGDKISDLNPLWPLGTDPVSQGDDHVRLIKGVLQNDAVSKSADGVIDGDLTVDALAAETVNADTVNIEDDLNVTSSGFGGSFESVLTAKQSRPSKSLEQNLITSATDAFAAWSGFQFEISKGDSTADTDLVASITRNGLEVTGDLTVSGAINNSAVSAPNILINPSFTVKQRGDVIDHTATTFGPDRWRVRGTSGAGGTLSQSSTEVDPTTGANKLVVNHTGATSEGYIYQIVEAVNIQGMYGKEMTFSFSYEDTGGSGTPKAFIRSYDSGATIKTLLDATPTSLGSNRWTCTFTLSTDDGTFPDPSESGLIIQIEANEGNTAPSKWKVWETKLEAGSAPTTFVARQYGEELSLCQRYYEAIDYSQRSTATGVYSVYGATSDVWLGPKISFKVSKRAAPTITNTDTWRRASQPGGTVTNIGPCGYSQIRVDGFAVTVPEANGPTGGSAEIICGSSSGLFKVDAEL